MMKIVMNMMKMMNMWMNFTCLQIGLNNDEMEIDSDESDFTIFNQIFMIQTMIKYEHFIVILLIFSFFLCFNK